MSDGDWNLYINNELMRADNDSSISKVIPSGGDFVLGQSYIYETDTAFVGDLAHYNIWNVILTSSERRDIFSSCKFMYCGNVVQWADFRSGTRGAMKLRWPSGIVSEYECCNKFYLIQFV